MKVAIIGGAGARVPLLTSGFLRFQDDLRIDEITLWDIHETRRQMAARVSRAMVGRHGGKLNVSLPETLQEALENASFVVSSIRVGGTAGRIQDETIALKHGTLGQETVGAGGFCLALRTIPVMIDYARQVTRHAPQAWLLNFTNPVGIISQALLEAGQGDRTVGICDTPREQFESLAHALDIPLDNAFFDYVGLNHLGWVRRILSQGTDRLPELLASDERLANAYRIPLFEISFLRRLQLLPTEYLYYYYDPERARRETTARGSTRGQLVLRLEEELTQAVASHPDRPESVLEAYDRYLASRNASYMAVETGGRVDEETIARAREHLYSSAAGYDRIAIDVMRAIRNHRPTVMPVDVANQGAIPDLEAADAVEVPCVIDSNGARPLAAGSLPEQVRELVLQVKRYERLTVRAALEESRDLAEQALAANPILESREQAGAILREYRKAHAPHLDYLN